MTAMDHMFEPAATQATASDPASRDRRPTAQGAGELWSAQARGALFAPSAEASRDAPVIPKSRRRGALPLPRPVGPPGKATRAYGSHGLAGLLGPHLGEGLKKAGEAGLLGLELLSPAADVPGMLSGSQRLVRGIREGDPLGATIGGLNLLGSTLAMALPGTFAQYKAGTRAVMDMVDDLPKRLGLLSITDEADIPGGGGASPALDMSEAARMQRAREMGYNLDDRLHRGLRSDKPVTEANPFDFYTRDRDMARRFAETGGAAGRKGEPVLLDTVHRIERPYTIASGAHSINDYLRIAEAVARQHGQDWADRIAAAIPIGGVTVRGLDDLRALAGQHGAITGLNGLAIMQMLENQFSPGGAARILREAGYDAIDTGRDMQRLTDKGVRRLDAAFDPARRDSPDLLAGIAPIGLLGGVAAAGDDDR